MMGSAALARHVGNGECRPLPARRANVFVFARVEHDMRWWVVLRTQARRFRVPYLSQATRAAEQVAGGNSAPAFCFRLVLVVHIFLVLSESFAGALCLSLSVHNWFALRGRVRSYLRLHSL